MLSRFFQPSPPHFLCILWLHCVMACVKHVMPSPCTLSEEPPNNSVSTYTIKPLMRQANHPHLCTWHAPPQIENIRSECLPLKAVASSDCSAHKPVDVGPKVDERLRHTQMHLGHSFAKCCAVFGIFSAHQRPCNNAQGRTTNMITDEQQPLKSNQNKCLLLLRLLLGVCNARLVVICHNLVYSAIRRLLVSHCRLLP